MISTKLAASIAMLDDVTRRARSMGLGLVAYPVDDVERVVAVLQAGSAATVADHSTLEAAPSAEDGQLARALDLLATLLDEPLMTLPGGDPGGTDGPTELRLKHFLPALSEPIACLLDEAGR